MYDVALESFIPYVQLHEFEAFLLVEPDRLLGMYPEKGNAVSHLKKEIGTMEPKTVNEAPDTAPSKRIIKHIPEYEGQKAQVGPLVAEDIGLYVLQNKCPHFDSWLSKLESLVNQ